MGIDEHLVNKDLEDESADCAQTGQLNFDNQSWWYWGTNRMAWRRNTANTPLRGKSRGFI